jgi:DNA-binding transcriptional MocR family regulator
MTNWLPGLEGFSGPRYLAIADALAADIREGRLAIGARLPTHRELAWKLGVTIGTVSRAYAEAERRGLIAGEVGRGTFVAEQRRAAAPRFNSRSSGVIELGTNRAPVGTACSLFAGTIAAMARDCDLPELLSYQPHAGREEDRVALASWLGRTACFEPDPDRLVLTDGAQQAMMVAVAAVTRPGDAVGVECLTYPGMKALAAFLDLKLVPLAIDGEGLLPEAFEAACREQRIRALYAVPNIQNPTGGVLSEERRRRLARIAEACDVPIIEDDVYGFLLEDPPPPICAFTRTHALYAGGASKSLAPGLRVGWVHAPPQAIERATAAIRATTYTATPTMTEIVKRWIRGGEADALVEEKRRLACARQTKARLRLGQGHVEAHPRAFHLWLHLPEPWRADDYAAAARRRNVSITPARAFSVGRSAVPEAVRLCLGGAETEEELDRALEVLGCLLLDAPQPYLSVV